MSQRDDGSPKTSAPPPKPPVPSAPVSRRSFAGGPPPPPPIPVNRPPPVGDANPFLPESSGKIDAGWASLEETAEALDDTDLSPVSAAMAAHDPATAAAVPPAAAVFGPAAALAPARPRAPSMTDEASSTANPFRKKSRAKALAFVLLPLLVLGGAGLAYQAQMGARAREQAAPPASTPTPVETVAPAVEPAPPPTHNAEPPPSASAPPKPAPAAAALVAPESIDPQSRGFVDTSGLPPGRKILVDGRVVGSSPRKVPVRCGTHRIKIGDWDPETIQIPCGGEVTFTE